MAIYAPYAFDIMLDLDLIPYTVVLIDLATRRVAVPDVVTGTRSLIRMHPFNADVLVIAHKGQAAGAAG